MAVCGTQAIQNTVEFQHETPSMEISSWPRVESNTNMDWRLVDNKLEATASTDESWGATCRKWCCKCVHQPSTSAGAEMRYDDLSSDDEALVTTSVRRSAERVRHCGTHVHVCDLLHELVQMFSMHLAVLVSSIACGASFLDHLESE